MKEPLSSDDKQNIRSRIVKALFQLARIYFPFFIALVIANYTGRRKGVGGTIGLLEYQKIYAIVAIVFSVIFIVYLILDIKKRILPYIKEGKAGEKNLSVFHARKYFDPIHKQYLLFHPFNDNVYLTVPGEVFDAISNGQEIELQSGAGTSVLLSLKINDKVIREVEEFRFK